MSPSARLGDLEELVLLAVLGLGAGASGADVRAAVAERAGRTVTVSTVYVTLMRLEEKGWARSSMSGPEPVRGGKARRLYRVTPEGVEALEARREVRERMWAGIDARQDPARAD